MSSRAHSRIPVAVIIGTLAMGAASPLAGQAQPGPQASSARRISVTWQGTPIRDVLLAFAAFSGRSIVAGEGVDGFVTADINDQPWDVALRTILSGRGLVATENEHGIILVEDMGTLDADSAIEPIITRTYRISFVPVEEIRVALTPLLSERGSISVSPSTNSVIVSDIARVHRAIAGTLR